MAKFCKSDKYLLAFREAECFMSIANDIKEKTYLKTLDKKEMDRSVNYQYANCVNHAYAFELYLKCLIIIERGGYYYGHNLLEQFNLLTETSKNNIETRFKTNYAFIRRNTVYWGMFDEPTIYELLAESSNAFVEFRYLFEGSGTHPYMLDGVLQCVRQEIFLNKPELENKW